MMDIFTLILAIIVVLLVIIQEKGMFIYDLFCRKPTQIHHTRKTPTQSITLRPTTCTRQYAYAHLHAFTPRKNEHLNTVFFQSLEQTNTNDLQRTPWTHAKQWWEELYGPIQDHDEEKSEISPIDNLKTWYNKHHRTPQKNALDRYAMQIITQSYHQIMERMTIDELSIQEKVIKRHLRTLHPDKKGTSSAAILLIEWRELINSQAKQIIHNQKLPLTGLTELYQGKAKPWIIYELFLQHIFSVREQLHRNIVEQTSQHTEEMNSTIISNNARISMNETLIYQLENNNRT